MDIRVQVLDEVCQWLWLVYKNKICKHPMKKKMDTPDRVRYSKQKIENRIFAVSRCFFSWFSCKS